MMRIRISSPYPAGGAGPHSRSPRSPTESLNGAMCLGAALQLREGDLSLFCLRCVDNPILRDQSRSPAAPTLKDSGAEGLPVQVRVFHDDDLETGGEALDGVGNGLVGPQEEVAVLSDEFGVRPVV